MKKALTPIFLLCAITLMAQPTVNSDWLPQIGDRLSNVTITVDAPVSPGAAGENIDYDFSELPVPDTPFVAFFDVVDPSSTPFAAQFEESDICLTANLLDIDIYTYAAINNGCIEDIGSVAFGGLVVQTYTNPRNFACAPLNYQDAYSDSYEASGEFLGVVTHSTGTAETVVDGWGTLKMPGTGMEISNVLRLIITEHEVDSTDLGSGIREKLIYETTTYNFVSADYKNVLVSMSVAQETQIGMADGIPNDTIVRDPEYDFTYDPDPQEIGTAGIDPVSPNEISMNLYPNPVNEILQLKFESEKTENVLVRIFDYTGRQVSTLNESVFEGENLIPVDVQNMTTGMYILTLQGEKYMSSLKFTRE